MNRQGSPPSRSHGYGLQEYDMHNPSFTNEPCSHRARYFQMNVTPWLEESKRSHLTRIARLGCIRVFVLGVTFFAGTIAEAATYYVATNGSDSRSCLNATSTSTPLRTINTALDCLTPGDTLYIRGGTYTEAIDSNRRTIPTGTSWNAPITIAGYSGEVVTLKPAGSCAVLNLPAPYLQYIIFKDMVLDAADLGKSQYSCVGISLQPGTHHLRFQNLEVKNSPWSGIMGGGTSHEFINLKVHDNGQWTQSIGYGSGANGAYLTTDSSVIDGGEWYNNLCYGIRFFDSDSSQSGDSNIVKNARIYKNGHTVAFNGTAQCPSGGGGIVLGDVNNAAFNNLVYGNYWGIQTGSKPSAVLIYNNTLSGNKYGIDVGAGSLNAQVKNNILYQNGTGISNTGTGTTFAANLCSTAGLGCSIVGDPRFSNAAAFDFRILAGSPAIDVGTQLGVVAEDFARIRRPQGAGYDVGAYEVGGGGVDTVAPAPPTNVQLM